MIIVDQYNDDFIKVRFKYSQLYVNMFSRLNNQIQQMRYEPKNKQWLIPIDSIPLFEKEIGDRLYWRTPRWVIMNESPPDYTELYQIPDYELISNDQLTLYKYQEYGSKYMIDRLINLKMVFNTDSVGLG